MLIEPIVDAHQHFWILGKNGHEWPDDQLPQIHRDYLPPDLRGVATRSSVRQWITVQSQPSVEDTEWLLGLASENPEIVGVVGWVDLEGPSAHNQIRQFAARPKAVGLRPMLHNLDDPQWILRPAVMRSLGEMADLELSLDCLVRTLHLPVVREAAAETPGLRIVIDHAAKPSFSGKEFGAWKYEIEQIAALPNVFCKLSGLVTECGPTWTARRLGSYCDHILEAFGPRRVMWGSDWPVVNLVTSYTEWLEAAQALVGNDYAPEVFSGTAQRFYRYAS